MAPRTREGASHSKYLYHHHLTAAPKRLPNMRQSRLFTPIAQHGLSFPVSPFSPVFSSPILLPLAVGTYDIGSRGNSSADF